MKRPLLILTTALLTTLLAVAAPGGARESAAPGTTLRIVSDLPMQGSDRVQTEQMVRAIQFLLKQSGGKAGKYTIDFVPHDDSTRAAGKWDEAKCFANAKSYVADPQVVGVIGTYNSGCAALEIPILNAASLGMVSPANTYQGLTRSGPGTDPGEPFKYYPSGRRNYMRVVAPDVFQGIHGAAFMKRTLHVTRVFLLDDRELYGKGVADAFEAEANRIGLRVVGHEGWYKDAQNYVALMQKIKASGANGLFIGGVSTNNGGQLIADKVAFVGSNRAVKVLTSDGFVLSSLYDEAGSNVVGLWGMVPTVPPNRLSGTAQQFLRAFARSESGGYIEIYTPYAVAAAQVLLQAIKRSNGTRQDVLAKLHATNLGNTIVGPIAFDQNGDPRKATEAIYKAGPQYWTYAGKQTR